MEPILELATRITSHLWFAQQRSVPEGTPFLEAAEPHDYSELQNILDLAGQSATWKSAEWIWNFDAPSVDPGSSPSWYNRTAIREWQARKSRYDLEIAKNRALLLIESRLESLPESLRASGDDRSTREDLFERVAHWLYSAPLSQRVRLALVFIPSTGEPGSTVQKFFIEERIDEAVQRRRKSERRPTNSLARLWSHARTPRRRFALLLHPDAFLQLCRELGVGAPVSAVIHDELDEIGRSRRLRFGGIRPGQLPKHPHDVRRMGPGIREAAGIGDARHTAHRQAFLSNLFGVAFSGGGIRSATFALGLLEGMADRNVLPYVDILSTVSGGGYIGSWLISWIKRRSDVRSVQESLRGNATSLQVGPTCPDRRTKREDAPDAPPFHLVSRNVDPHSDHVRPLRMLRSYASYLAPESGLFSADTWTIVTTWARNTFLNLLVLITLLGALLLLPRIAVFALYHLGALVRYGSTFAIEMWICGVLLCVACLLVTLNLRASSDFGDRGVFWKVVFGTVLPGVCMEVAVLWYLADSGVSALESALAFGFISLIGMLLLAFAGIPHDPSGFTSPKRYPSAGIRLLAAVASASTGGLLAWALHFAAESAGTNTERGIWIAASAGVALTFMVVVNIIVIFIGLMGDELADQHREWWSRLGAWLVLSIVVWLVVCAICFFMPLWMSRLAIGAGVAGIGWSTLTAWGAKLAYSPKSGRGGDTGNPVYAVVLAVAPAAFVFGLLSLVSFGLFCLLEWLVQQAPWLANGPVSQDLYGSNAPFTLQRAVDYYWILMYPGSIAAILLAAVLGLLCGLLAWRVDINQFSMHNFYKNRLVRCYLGASRSRLHRVPNNFTGFDPEDDIRLMRFHTADPSQPRDTAIECKASYVGPYPIINTALNVTQGQDLGLQERKAESFIFTPMWSGFDYSRRQAAVAKTSLSEYGFRLTKEFGEPKNGGVHLGTAMAISGAAFNTNMGFHTSPTLAFLLTVFGVRLGWWAGNPIGRKWDKPSPTLGLLYLGKELTANTRTDSDFVLLSDGGHFENMGLYELIRRRCRYIILSDAEEDEKFKLEGIGGAIRKCRVDFGVVIDLNLEALQPLGDPAYSRLHYTLGTILYPGEKDCAKLVYIKSSVTGDEPVDVVEFRKRHPEFPHTSTVNQFFAESHFESYRALGHHVAGDVFTWDMPEQCDPGGLATEVEKLFGNIEDVWTQRLKAIRKENGRDKADAGKS